MDHDVLGDGIDGNTFYKVVTSQRWAPASYVVVRPIDLTTNACDCAVRGGTLIKLQDYMEPLP